MFPFAPRLLLLFFFVSLSFSCVSRCEEKTLSFLVKTREVRNYIQRRKKTFSKKQQKLQEREVFSTTPLACEVEKLSSLLVSKCSCLLSEANLISFSRLTDSRKKNARSSNNVMIKKKTFQLTSYSSCSFSAFFSLL